MNIAIWKSSFDSEDQLQFNLQHDLKEEVASKVFLLVMEFLLIQGITM